MGAVPQNSAVSFQDELGQPQSEESYLADCWRDALLRVREEAVRTAIHLPVVDADLKIGFYPQIYMDTSRDILPLGQYGTLLNLTFRRGTLTSLRDTVWEAFRVKGGEPSFEAWTDVRDDSVLNSMRIDFEETFSWPEATSGNSLLPD